MHISSAIEPRMLTPVIPEMAFVRAWRITSASLLPFRGCPFMMLTPPRISGLPSFWVNA